MMNNLYTYFQIVSVMATLSPSSIECRNFFSTRRPTEENSHQGNVCCGHLLLHTTTPQLSSFKQEASLISQFLWVRNLEVA